MGVNWLEVLIKIKNTNVYIRKILNIIIFFFLGFLKLIIVKFSIYIILKRYVLFLRHIKREMFNYLQV